MSRVPKCCVLNCCDKTSVRHRFPKNEKDVFEIWKQRAQHPRFKEISHEHIYEVYTMCGAHFEPEDKIPNSKKLKKRVLPTINIPGLDETVKMIKNVSSGDKAMVDDGHCKVLVRVDLNKKPVKRKSDDLDPESVGEKASKKTKISSMNECVQELVMNNKPVAVEPNTINVNSTPKTHDIHTRRDTRKPGVRGKRLTCLQDVGVTRVNDLTPKARKLHGIAARFQRVSAKLHKKCISFKHRLSMAESAFKNGSLQYLTDKLNTTTSKFFTSQLRNQSKHLKGRRYTLDDKILALSLMKQSGKSFRLLRKIFALPSEKSLRTLLQKVNLQPGINAPFFDKLKKTGQLLSKRDKNCILLWDEMAIEPNLYYSQKLDKVVGFQDYGNDSRMPKFACHALVFMAKGIFKKWKQPLAYMFTGTGDQTQLLRKAIVNVIKAIQNAGFRVIGTVCDQGACNQAAINYLLKTKAGKHMSFRIGNDEIFPLYDPPHLLKGMRNNLLTKELHFEINGDKKVARWQDIVDLYMMDTGDGEMRILTKLTDRHILPDKIKKMKVSYAAQVLSQSVSALMKRFIQWDPTTAMTTGTADFCQFMDRVFDSVNGYQLRAPPGKELRSAVTSSSSHIEHWYYAIKVLETMKFYDANRKKFVSPPSAKNWIVTLRRLIVIHQNLLKDGCHFITPRVFNQDAIENLFGCIRSHAVRATKPTPTAFTSSFKSTAINKISSYHTKNFNCEDEESDGILANLKNLLSNDTEVSSTEQFNDNIKIPTSIPLQSTKISKCIQVYVSGYIVKKLKKSFGECSDCMANLQDNNNNCDTEFIEDKQYKNGVLTRPNYNFNYIVGRCIGLTNYLLPKICHQDNVTKIISGYLKKNIPLQILNCKQHKIVDKFPKLISKLLVFHWCKSVNKILCGRNIKFLKSSGEERNSRDKTKVVDAIKKKHTIYT